jgi:SAM-dependent methyltransferase
MDGEYDLAAETQHTQQMTWGDAHHGAQLNDFKQRMYQSILSQLIKRTPASGCSLLDVGCAYGGFMSAARAAGFDVSGYDIVPEAVQAVQAAGMPAQCCGRMQDFTLRSEPLDVITVLDANIYWPDQPAELRAIHDRLKPGGLLVMRVVDKSWLAKIGAAVQSVSPARGERLLRRAVNDHRFSMPLGSFLKVLQRSGFRVLSASPRGAIHSDQTSLPVRLSFHLGTALWETLGIFLAPGAVVFAERS